MHNLLCSGAARTSMSFAPLPNAQACGVPLSLRIAASDTSARSFVPVLVRHPISQPSLACRASPSGRSYLIGQMCPSPSSPVLLLVSVPRISGCWLCRSAVLCSDSSRNSDPGRAEPPARLPQRTHERAVSANSPSSEPVERLERMRRGGYVYSLEATAVCASRYTCGGAVLARSRLYGCSRLARSPARQTSGR